ncbi:MAG: hypothetical protein JJ900_11755 [Rhodospirillales bacterium]|nr:hypothetical protein [Rhodospirillales bacterium]MBO6787516.1 hypothetical protein [Rhodospirillales bacterium]
MGGFFSPPAPAPLPPPPPAPDPAADERERRLEAIERRRRGRAGTIATSERGVLEERSGSSSTVQAANPLKDKLGE